MISRSRASPHLWSVAREGGLQAIYDTRAWRYREQRQDHSRRDGKQWDPAPRDCVPVYCDRCHAGSAWERAPEPRVLVQLLWREAPRALVVAGVVCISQTGDGEQGGAAATGSPASAAAGRDYCDKGDLLDLTVERYYRHSAYARTLFQPRGRLMYGHQVPAGRVVAYWHVHRGATLYVNALAVVDDRGVTEAAGRYIAVDETVALSLGTYTYGHEEMISELSVVLVPARQGCFGRSTADLTLLPDILTSLGYPAGRGQGVRAPHLPPAARSSPSETAVLKATLNMVAGHRDILKLTNAHPGQTNIEKYINRGLYQYADLISGKPPKLLMANMLLKGAASSALTADVQTQLVRLGEVLAKAVAGAGARAIDAVAAPRSRRGRKEGRRGGRRSSRSRRRRSRSRSRSASESSESESSEDSEQESKRRRRKRGGGGSKKATANNPPITEAGIDPNSAAILAEFRQFIENNSAEKAAAAAAPAAAPAAAAPAAPLPDFVAELSQFKTHMTDLVKEAVAAMAVPQAQQQAPEHAAAPAVTAPAAAPAVVEPPAPEVLEAGLDTQAEPSVSSVLAAIMDT